MTRESKAKPFPWRCPKCMRREVRPAMIEYTSRVKHDGKVHDVTVAELTAPKCTACGEVVFSNDTEEQISRALRSQLRLLQPSEIREKRERLGLTQAQLAERLCIAQETISRWETGAMIQSRSLDRLLRVFFRFPDAFAALDEAEAAEDSERTRISSARRRIASSGG